MIVSLSCYHILSKCSNSFWVCLIKPRVRPIVGQRNHIDCNPQACHLTRSPAKKDSVGQRAKNIYKYISNATCSPSCRAIRHALIWWPFVPTSWLSPCHSFSRDKKESTLLDNFLAIEEERKGSLSVGICRFSSSDTLPIDDELLGQAKSLWDMVHCFGIHQNKP